MEKDAVTHALRQFASRGESDHTNHYPHRISEHATKQASKQTNKLWNGKPKLAGVNVRHLYSKTPVGVLTWTARVNENDQADRLASKETITNGLLLGRSQVFRDLRHLPADTKPRASHHRLLGVKG